jgi:rod shape-determining protein MreD
MRWLRFTLILLLASLLQSGSLSDFMAVTAMRIKPDFLLILLVFFAINCDAYDAIIASFAIGFAADITGTVMGPFTLTFGALGSVLTHIRQVILLKKNPHQAIIIFVMGILAGGIAKFLALLKIQSGFGYSFWHLAGTALYSALLWFLIKWAVQAIGKWVGAGRSRLALRR